MKKKTSMNIDIHGQKYNRKIVFSLILFATFAGVLMQTSLATALPTLMRDFDIDLSTAQQASTWFLLANGIMVPLSAYLSTRIPTRWLHFIAYGILLIGITLTISTPNDSNYWLMFIIGRVLSAIAVGIMMPLMQILIMNMFKVKERAIAMGLYGLVVGVAPAIGPTLSGWILDQEHHILGLTLPNTWQMIFIIPMIIIAITFVLSPFILKDIIPNDKIKLDFPSLMLSIFGFGFFLWGFTNVASDGWLDVFNVILPIFLGVILLIVFGLRQLNLHNPFLDIRVFKTKEFTLATIALILVTMAMFGVEMMLPTYMQNVHGLSPLHSGLALLPGALMFGFMAPITGVLYNRLGVKRLAFIGFFILALGTVPFIFLTENTPPSLITVLYAIRMFGVSICMMPLTTAAMSALAIKDATHGTAANATLRQISSSVVVALLSSVTQNIINENTPPPSMQVNDPLGFASKVIDASMDGFRASFTIGLIFAIVGFIFIFFLKDTQVVKEDQ